MKRRPFTRADFDARRMRPWSIFGITLTDQCPVGCAHCSVAATLDDHGPASNPGFLEDLRRLCEIEPIEVVIITGGEPFMQPEVLERTCRLLTGAGKRVVVHTSGYWGTTARGARPEIRAILRRIDTLVLGVDLYHRDAITDERLCEVLRTAAEHGAWLVLQTLAGDDGARHEAYARAVLDRVFGDDWAAHAELVRNQPLHVGRARSLAAFAPTRSAAGRCDLVHRPMLRFDGEVLACCNESVIRGQGPQRLRRRVNDHDVQAALEQLAADPLVEMLEKLPTGMILQIVSLVHGRKLLVAPASRCDACWRAAALLEELDADERARVRSLVHMACGSTVAPAEKPVEKPAETTEESP